MGVIADRPTHDVVDRAPSFGAVGARDATRATTRRRATPRDGARQTMLRAIARRASRAAATTRARAISTARDARDDATDARRRRINRALYRAKQRGFLELDIVVGEWAARAMASTTTTSDGFLDALDAVLDVENPELFKWLTAQETAPREMRENEAYASLAAHCAKFLDEKSSEASRAAHGREWIRGWNDSGAGNQ